MGGALNVFSFVGLVGGTCIAGRFRASDSLASRGSCPYIILVRYSRIRLQVKSESIYGTLYLHAIVVYMVCVACDESLAITVAA